MPVDLWAPLLGTPTLDSVFKSQKPLILSQLWKFSIKLWLALTINKRPVPHFLPFSQLQEQLSCVNGTCNMSRGWNRNGCWRRVWRTMPPSRCTSGLKWDSERLRQRCIFRWSSLLVWRHMKPDRWMVLLLLLYLFWSNKVKIMFVFSILFEQCF